MVQDKQSYALVIRMFLLISFYFAWTCVGFVRFFSVGPDPLAARAKPKFMGGLSCGLRTTPTTPLINTYLIIFNYHHHCHLLLIHIIF